MKTPALGSLSALAILCATPFAHSAVILSSTVVNVGLPSFGAQSPVDLDIDGDGTADFKLEGNFDNVGVLSLDVFDPNGNNNVAIASSGGYDFVKAFQPTSTIDGSQSFSNFGYLYVSSETAGSPSAQQSFYAGVEFTGQDSLNHFGWLRFSFPSSGPNVVVSAAYESIANASIAVVPEPLSYGIASAVALGAFAAYRRRTV